TGPVRRGEKRELPSAKRPTNPRESGQELGLEVVDEEEPGADEPATGRNRGEEDAAGQSLPEFREGKRARADARRRCLRAWDDSRRRHVQFATAHCFRATVVAGHGSAETPRAQKEAPAASRVAAIGRVLLVMPYRRPTTPIPSSTRPNCNDRGAKRT